MRSYLLIESQGPQENPDACALFDLGLRLHEAGHAVTVYLIQNGVLALAAGTVCSELVERGVRVVADDYSLAARGLGAGLRRPGIGAGAMPDLVRSLLADGTVAVWH